MRMGPDISGEEVGCCVGYPTIYWINVGSLYVRQRKHPFPRIPSSHPSHPQPAHRHLPTPVPYPHHPRDITPPEPCPRSPTLPTYQHCICHSATLPKSRTCPFVQHSRPPAQPLTARSPLTLLAAIRAGSAGAKGLEGDGLGCCSGSGAGGWMEGVIHYGPSTVYHRARTGRE